MCVCVCVCVCARVCVCVGDLFNPFSLKFRKVNSYELDKIYRARESSSSRKKQDFSGSRKFIHAKFFLVVHSRKLILTKKNRELFGSQKFLSAKVSPFKV